MELVYLPLFTLQVIAKDRDDRSIWFTILSENMVYDALQAI